MSAKPDLGLEAVRRVAKLWSVDDDRTRQVENGFDWWPGRFQVSVRSDKHPDESNGAVWRLSVKTALLKEISPDDDKMQKEIFTVARLAPSYAWVYPPAELAQLYFRPEFGGKSEIPEEVNSRIGRVVWFQTTVYLRTETAGWLPDFLSGLAILQPIDAEWQADPAAEHLGGHPDVSRASKAAPHHPDDVLNVARVIYLPAGQQASRWKGSDEFRDIVERYGRSYLCFGVGDPDGVALETSIGPHSAMIAVRADVSHPLLGTGLLASLELPPMTEQAARYECLWLNYYEASVWTHIPQLAGWYPKEIGQGLFEPCSTFFIPNALYRPLLATNAALWQLARARWVKEERWPDLKDLTMGEIIEQRLTQEGQLG